MRRRILLLSVFGVTLAVVFGLAGGTNAFADIPIPLSGMRLSPSDNPETRAQQVPQHPSQGIPAITPRAAAEPGQPAFAAEDVVAYLKSHSPQFADRSKPEPVIEQIEFLTAQEVESRLQTTTDGRPPDALVCLVTLRGDFIGRAPAGFSSPTGHTGYMIFDATTGNLLIEAVIP